MGIIFTPRRRFLVEEGLSHPCAAPPFDLRDSRGWDMCPVTAGEILCYLLGPLLGRISLFFLTKVQMLLQGQTKWIS